jgi:hypothetical protein
MKLEFSRQIFENTHTKFHENPSIGSRLVPCGRTRGQTDMMKLIVPFRSYVDAPKIVARGFCCYAVDFVS